MAAFAQTGVRTQEPEAARWVEPSGVPGAERATENALTAVIQEACAPGISIRLWDDLAQALGMSAV